MKAHSLSKNLSVLTISLLCSTQLFSQSKKEQLTILQSKLDSIQLVSNQQQETITQLKLDLNKQKEEIQKVQKTNEQQNTTIQKLETQTKNQKQELDAKTVEINRLNSLINTPKSEEVDFYENSKADDWVFAQPIKARAYLYTKPDGVQMTGFLIEGVFSCGEIKNGYMFVDDEHTGWVKISDIQQSYMPKAEY